jgi:hypothetical protein
MLISILSLSIIVDYCRLLSIIVDYCRLPINRAIHSFLSVILYIYRAFQWESGEHGTRTVEDRPRRIDRTSRDAHVGSRVCSSALAAFLLSADDTGTGTRTDCRCDAKMEEKRKRYRYAIEFST